jgi:hypothetical protein
VCSPRLSYYPLKIKNYDIPCFKCFMFIEKEDREKDKEDKNIKTIIVASGHF